MEEDLKITNLGKSFGNLKVFDNFSISFRENQVNCILGPSGCGKTTLLNIICGSLKADSIDRMPFHKHRFSYVFQEPRLLPWKTTIQNILFTLKDKVPENKLSHTAEEYLELVELDQFRHYYPHQLSGGMKQRLSLARAFSFPSDIILMDEPFKALDIKLKNNLIRRFRELWKKDQRTVIFVTHDVDEALKLGHKIMVFSTPPVKILKEYQNSAENSLRREITDLMSREDV
ncbi:MAG: ABC transporter ATP-binding protein [Bacteroidales bacterium]